MANKLLQKYQTPEGHLAYEIFWDKELLPYTETSGITLMCMAWLGESNSGYWISATYLPQQYQRGNGIALVGTCYRQKVCWRYVHIWCGTRKGLGPNKAKVYCVLGAFLALVRSLSKLYGGVIMNIYYLLKHKVF